MVGHEDVDRHHSWESYAGQAGTRTDCVASRERHVPSNAVEARFVAVREMFHDHE